MQSINNTMERVIFNEEKRTIHTLIMRAMNSRSIGLFDGKMGVAIAFYHLARHSDNVVYERYADVLLDSVMNSVTQDADLSLATGLSGIGWGIEYLLQSGFAQGDSSEICEQIDRRIMLYDPRRMSETSLDDLIHYILMHCKNRVMFDSQYISDVEAAVSQRRNIRFSVVEHALYYRADIMQFVAPIDMSDEIYHTKPIGINGGLAGVLMRKYVII